MNRCWEMYRFFGLLIANFWVIGDDFGFTNDEMVDLYRDAAFRLRVNLMARTLR